MPTGEVDTQSLLHAHMREQKPQTSMIEVPTPQITNPGQIGLPSFVFKKIREVHAECW